MRAVPGVTLFKGQLHRTCTRCYIYLPSGRREFQHLAIPYTISLILALWQFRWLFSTVRAVFAMYSIYASLVSFQKNRGPKVWLNVQNEHRTRTRAQFCFCARAVLPTLILGTRKSLGYRLFLRYTLFLNPSWCSSRYVQVLWGTWAFLLRNKFDIEFSSYFSGGRRGGRLTLWLYSRTIITFGDLITFARFLLAQHLTRRHLRVAAILALGEERVIGRPHFRCRTSHVKSRLSDYTSENDRLRIFVRGSRLCTNYAANYKD